MHKEASFTEARTLGIKEAARYFGVSPRTFRDRLMPRIPAIVVSAPDASRQCRRFSIPALEEALKSLVRPAAA